MRQFVASFLLTLPIALWLTPSVQAVEKPLTLIVMDPLAAPLSCPCVEGYAQRKYEAFATHLKEASGREVHLVFAQALSTALKETASNADVIIGKDSVVRADAAAAKIEILPVAQLTDKTGSTTQYGMIVVNKADPAVLATDLNGYTIIFGPSEAAEKHSAALQLLKESKVSIPKTLHIDEACSDGACKVIDLGPESRTAAVISSYAQPLLEGCGTIKKGDLRVVGQTKPVPFITAFVNSSLSEDERHQIKEALLSVKEQPQLLDALESLAGFLAYEDVVAAKKITEPENPSDTDAENSWPQWREPSRTGLVKWLPQTLSSVPNVIWDVPLGKAGLGGLAANEQHVFFGDRDLDDFQDIYRCLDAKTGAQLWAVPQLAIGMLDYGNSPRATPIIHGDNVIFCGAFGDLSCVQIATGKVRWHINLRSEFKPTEDLPWGYCGSPLLIDGKLIVNPGAADASVVAVNAEDGSVAWKSAGLNSGYGSFIAGSFGGRRQIVGHDARSIGGWDITTGKRLWTITPPFGGEFNVPTPVHIRDGRLLVSTEQNGTRLFEFNSIGEAESDPVAANRQLTPDMSSPVAVGDLVFCVNNFLYCLDTTGGLRERWRIRDNALSAYGSIIASPDQLLVVGDGELLLLKANGDKAIVARQRIFDANDRLYSFPALVGTRLFVRGESHLRCIELE